MICEIDTGLQWLSPLEDVDDDNAPSGEIDRFRRLTGVIKQDFGIEIQFAVEVGARWGDTVDPIRWRIGEEKHRGPWSVRLLPRDQFHAFLWGIIVGAGQLATRTVS